MAIQTGNATSNGSFSNVSISGSSTKTGNITWDAPSLPSNATITSTTLTASLNISMTLSTATVTINGTSHMSSSQSPIHIWLRNELLAGSSKDHHQTLCLDSCWWF